MDKQNITRCEWPVIISVTEEQSLNIEAYRYRLDAYEIMVRQCTGKSNPEVSVMSGENYKILLESYQTAFVEFNVAFSELARLAASEYPMGEYIVQLNYGNNSLVVFPRGYQGEQPTKEECEACERKGSPGCTY